MSILSSTAAVIGYLSVIAGLMVFLVKIWRKIKKIAEGQQCQLRSDITGIYYRHSDAPDPTLREYERQNLDDLYDGYKVLGGNHYVDDIYAKMRGWRVTK